jgi:hypothetical protein
MKTFCKIGNDLMSMEYPKTPSKQNNNNNLLFEGLF